MFDANIFMNMGFMSSLTMHNRAYNTDPLELTMYAYINTN